MPAPLFLKRQDEKMKEKIENLYQKVVEISAAYLIYQERETVKLVKKIIPQVQEFTLWFLEGNKFGIEDDLYQSMSRNLLVILEDILEALKQEDRVLLQDALAYGLMGYLDLFIEKEQEEEEDDAV